MNLLTIIAGIVGFSVVMADFWGQIAEERRPGLRRWFRNWTIKGLIVPSVVWIFFNCAVSEHIPTLMARVEFAKINGGWMQAILDVATFGLFVIATYWAAVTSAWLLAEMSRVTPDRRQFRNCALLWSIILAPVAATIILSFGWRFAGLGVTLWLVPITQQALALTPEKRIPPVYSRAIAAMKFGKYTDAEEAVLKELEACEEDFDGWMMLAELYAIHFDDLTEAENLVRQTCGDPSINASQFAVAHHKLADWYLNRACDPVAARNALWEICRRHPNSHLDKMARLRLNTIPTTREELLAQSERKLIRIKPRRNPDGPGIMAAPGS